MRSLFQNKVAVVTGGAAGLGRALCEQLAEAGAFVVVADINYAEAREVASLIGTRGGQAEAMHVDVANATEVDKLADDVVAGRGRLDYMFNNAAIAAVGEVRDGNIKDFRRVVDVNLLGVVQGSMAAYRVMLREGTGHIVNIGSATGLMPNPVISAYSTTKWAVVGFTMALRAEAIGLGIKVSLVCPGLIRTNISDRNFYWNVRKEDYLKLLPWRWMIEPEAAAGIILRGVARNRELIVFPFSLRAAWWIHRICPSLVNLLTAHMVARFRAIRGGGCSG